jgi:hypothetical protein
MNVVKKFKSEKKKERGNKRIKKGDHGSPIAGQSRLALFYFILFFLSRGGCCQCVFLLLLLALEFPTVTFFLYFNSIFKKN